MYPYDRFIYGPEKDDYLIYPPTQSPGHFVNSHIAGVIEKDVPEVINRLSKELVRHKSKWLLAVDAPNMRGRNSSHWAKKQVGAYNQHIRECSKILKEHTRPKGIWNRLTQQGPELDTFRWKSVFGPAGSRPGARMWSPMRFMVVAASAVVGSILTVGFVKSNFKSTPSPPEPVCNTHNTVLPGEAEALYQNAISSLNARGKVNDITHFDIAIGVFPQMVDMYPDCTPVELSAKLNAVMEIANQQLGPDPVGVIYSCADIAGKNTLVSMDPGPLVPDDSPALDYKIAGPCPPSSPLGLTEEFAEKTYANIPPGELNHEIRSIERHISR